MNYQILIEEEKRQRAKLTTLNNQLKELKADADRLYPNRCEICEGVGFEQPLITDASNECTSCYGLGLNPLDRMEKIEEITPELARKIVKLTCLTSAVEERIEHVSNRVHETMLALAKKESVYAEALVDLRVKTGLGDETVSAFTMCRSLSDTPKVFTEHSDGIMTIKARGKTFKLDVVRAYTLYFISYACEDYVENIRPALRAFLDMHTDHH